MAKHTPGPWRIHKDSRDRGYEVYGKDTQYQVGERELCRINSARSGAKRGMAVQFYPHPDDDANARLIAASPDLLGALKELLDVTGRTGLSVDTASIPAAAAKARAAINKAGGGDGTQREVFKAIPYSGCV